MVRINGENFDIAGKTVEKYLIETGYDVNRVALELNGDILPKSDYGKALLNDGDSLEIVCFVGGG